MLFRSDEFDPLRFYRLRTQAKDEGLVEKAANNQFVSVNQSSLTFGYGIHACPGRFFAANEIKMILAHALLRYDVKLVGSETKRYPNIEFAHMVSQNNHSCSMCTDRRCSLFQIRLESSCSRQLMFERLDLERRAETN